MSFENPHLVLRLKQSYGDIAFPAPGGALGYYHCRGVDTSEDVSRWINHAIRCDYMGSAEFEIGAIPKALQEMAELAQVGGLVESEIVLSGKPSIECGLSGAKVDKLAQSKQVKCWLLCPKEILEALKPVIAELCEQDIPASFRPLEIPYMRRGLFGRVFTPYRSKKPTFEEGEYVGWYDLDQHWFLTKSEDQMKALKILFGL